MSFNPPVSIEQLRTLDDEPWQPVSPRYATQLRIYLLIYGAVFSALPWFLMSLEGEVRAWTALVSGGLGLLFLALIVFWVPRRVRHTQYLLRQLDMHMRTGLLWRRTTSVGINRIQHMEVTQGPLERGLGLSRLVLYTAGGMKSDLVLPGLPSETARRLKVKILGSPERPESESGIDESGE